MILDGQLELAELEVQLACHLVILDDHLEDLGVFLLLEFLEFDDL